LSAAEIDSALELGVVQRRLEAAPVARHPAEHEGVGLDLAALDARERRLRDADLVCQVRLRPAAPLAELADGLDDQLSASFSSIRAASVVMGDDRAQEPFGRLGSRSPQLLRGHNQDRTPWWSRPKARSQYLRWLRASQPSWRLRP
jgi:hypothetical protein